MITIIDYGAGNIASIKNMLKKIGFRSKISNHFEDIESATNIILPGVGSFDYGMTQLNELGLDKKIKDVSNEKSTPILGICLGAQLLGYKSEEGNLEGLGLVDMEVVKFDKERLSEKHKIPHMGWNKVIFEDMYRKYEVSDQELNRYYFVHSYHFKMKDTKQILCKSEYGYQFVCGVRRDNITGVQFHPEKSHKYGMHFFKQYLGETNP